MGYHACNGSYSHISFVPFPGTAALNVTIESVVKTKDTKLPADNFILVNSNASLNPAAASKANLSVVVHPSAFWDAFMLLRKEIIFFSEKGKKANTTILVLDAGELGSVIVSFSAIPLSDEESRTVGCFSGSEADSSSHFPCLSFAITDEPLAIKMSFADDTQLTRPPDITSVQRFMQLGVLITSSIIFRLIGTFAQVLYIFLYL